MYRVIREFVDLQDGHYFYAVGAEYPRKGYKPDEARFEALAGANNLQHRPMIEKVADPAPKVDKETNGEAGAAPKKTPAKKRTTKKSAD